MRKPLRCFLALDLNDALREHIDFDKSLYKDTYLKMQQTIDDKKEDRPFTQAPEKVVEKIIKALESKSPKPRYSVTTPTILLAVAKRCLPTRLLDALLVRIARA